MLIKFHINTRWPAILFSFSLCVCVCVYTYILLSNYQVSYIHIHTYIWVSQVAIVVKNPPAKAGDTRDPSTIPWSGRSPGGGHGYPLQYSCLENPIDRGAWQATVNGVTQSRTQLKTRSTQAYVCMYVSGLIKWKYIHD